MDPLVLLWARPHIDIFHSWHLLVGVIAAMLRFGNWKLPFAWWLAIMWAWEWVELAGIGPVGHDPSHLNSVLDVAAGGLGFGIVRGYTAYKKRWVTSQLGERGGDDRDGRGGA